MLQETPHESKAGRPPKFREACRPVTVTLPDRVLRLLEAVDPDRARAIVKCVESVVGDSPARLSKVDLVEVVPGQALIVVGPSRLLRQIEWLRLVEVAPGRCVLVIPTGMTVETLEVAIQDLLDDADPTECDERELLDQLRQLIRQQRRSKTVSKGELVFVALPKNGRQGGGSPASDLQDPVLTTGFVGRS